MSTRSNIAIKEKDDSVTVSYCHHDGYPEYTGKILLEHYNTEEKARALAENGYIRLLEKTIEETNEENFRSRTQPEYFDRLVMYMSEVDSVFIEYIYLWRDGQWWVSISEVFEPESVDLSRAFLGTVTYLTDFAPLTVVLWGVE
jgi:hypothetical protein